MLVRSYTFFLSFVLVASVFALAPKMRASTYGQCLYGSSLYELNTCLSTSGGTSSPATTSPSESSDNTTDDVDVTPDQTDESTAPETEQQELTPTTTEKEESVINLPAIILGLTAIVGGGLWVIVAYLRRARL